MNGRRPVKNSLSRRSVAVGKVRELGRFLKTKRAFGLPFAVRTMTSDAGRFVDFFASVKLQFVALRE